MRTMLESFAAGLAATKRSSASVALMSQLCARMEEEAEKSEPNLDQISSDNLAFHRAIVDAADNPRLTACLEPLWNFPVVVRKYGLFGRERLMRSLSHHKEIVSAIQMQDHEWAESIMRVHILAARSYDSALSQDDESDDGEIGQTLRAV